MTCSEYSCLVVIRIIIKLFFFFKQKTAYEMRISDWSSDVCSSDLIDGADPRAIPHLVHRVRRLFDLDADPAPVHRVFADDPLLARGKIGRASCRERECQYV